MLQAIRNRAQGWIAWIIIILISIPFALFGIQEYLGISGNPVVAAVNGVEIKEDDVQQRLRDFRDNMRLTLGDTYRSEFFEDAVLRPRILDAMIDESVLKQAVEAWNIRIGDDQLRAYIQTIPAFQREGRFDKGLYQNALRNRGMSSQGFESAIRIEMALNQLRRGIQDSHFITDAALAEHVRLDEQKRRIDYVHMPVSDFYATSEVTDEAAKAFYQTHQANYRIPEKVKVDYVRLDMAALSALIDLDEATLKAYFDDHRDEFFIAEERKLRHILLATAPENESTQQQKVMDLLEQLRSGIGFSALAEAHSDDPGSSANGGDLGWVSQGMMVSEFEQAAFALQAGAYSDPVKTEYGYHIIQVDQIRYGDNAGFADLRDEITARYRKQQAEDLYYTYFERMADLAYESPDSLIPAAELIGDPIKQSDWLSRGGQWDGVLNDPKIMNAVFSEEVLQGDNSDLIEIAPIDAVVVRIAEYEPAAVKPFVEVRQEVVAEVAAKLAREKVAETGERLLQKLSDGANLADLAAAESNWEFHAARQITRQQNDMPLEIVNASFLTAAPEAGATAYTGAASATGDYFLIAVRAVDDGDVTQLDEDARGARRQSLQNAYSDIEFTQLRQALREQAEVEIY
jgi:peptidyl-prolyl cis-trans isomerase D